VLRIYGRIRFSAGNCITPECPSREVVLGRAKEELTIRMAQLQQDITEVKRYLVAIAISQKKLNN
jgi:hypothetical protein